MLTVRNWLSRSSVDVVVILLIGTVSLTFFQGDYVIKGGGSSFPLDPSVALRWLPYTWHHEMGTGTRDFQSQGWLPYIGLIALMQLFGLSLSTSQQLLYYLLFSFSGISMYALVRYLTDGSRLPSIVSAAFYMMNPFTATNFWQGLQFASLPFLAPVLPLTFLIFHLGLKKDKAWYAVLASLVLTFGSLGMISSVAYSVSLFVILGSYVVFHLMLGSRITFVTTVKFVTVFVLSFLALNAWWIFPFVYFSSALYAGASSYYRCYSETIVSIASICQAPIAFVLKGCPPVSSFPQTAPAAPRSPSCPAGNPRCGCSR